MTDQEKLINVFVNTLEIPYEYINDSLQYKTEKRWDSAAHMLLIAQLESEFDIMLDIDDIIDMSSFSKAKEILKKYDNSLSF